MKVQIFGGVIFSTNQPSVARAWKTFRRYPIEQQAQEMRAPNLESWSKLYSVTSVKPHLLANLKFYDVLKVSSGAWDTNFKVGVDV